MTLLDALVDSGHVVDVPMNDPNKKERLVIRPLNSLRFARISTRYSMHDCNRRFRSGESPSTDCADALKPAEGESHLMVNLQLHFLLFSQSFGIISGKCSGRTCFAFLRQMLDRPFEFVFGIFAKDRKYLALW